MSAIINAHSLEQVVEIINAAADESNPLGTEYFGGTDTRSAEQMAAEYAADAAKESGYTDASSIEAHLEVLTKAGANFDVKAAMQQAAALI